MVTRYRFSPTPVQQLAAQQECPNTRAIWSHVIGVFGDEGKHGAGGTLLVICSETDPNEISPQQAIRNIDDARWKVSPEVIMTFSPNWEGGISDAAGTGLLTDSAFEELADS